jgi:Ca2+-binding RTX toxin-like protein
VEGQSGGDDMITIVGNGHGYVYGGGGADVIKITGYNPSASIYGGDGDDTCEAGPVFYKDCEN